MEKHGLSLAEWRQQQFREEVLPCGLAVQMRNVSLLDLAAQGLIPQTLLDIALGEDSDVEGTHRIRHYFEKLPEMLPALDTVTRATITHPLIADEPDDEHVGIREIPFESKLWVFQQMNAGVAQLATFRQEPDEPAAAGPDSE
jgi:hypothetical protein